MSPVRPDDDVQKAGRCDREQRSVRPGCPTYEDVLRWAKATPSEFLVEDPLLD